MKTLPPKFVFELSNTDLKNIRSAVRLWGKAEDIASEYSGSLLHSHLERWCDLVATDWSNWDISEYNHDIGCRTWIQVAIEHSETDTKSVLMEQVRSFDEVFQSKMKPLRDQRWHENAALSDQPYFWEKNTIHPGLY